MKKKWRVRLRQFHSLALMILFSSLPECGEADNHSVRITGDEQGVFQTEKLDASLKHAAAFLKERQSADGAWRSDVYAPFREGDALTPIVLVALQLLPNEQRPTDSVERGLDYLQKLVGEDGSILPPRPGIAYPVYMAAGAILAMGDRGDDASRRARDAWLSYLRERQLTERNGWQPEDIFYGGWGYAPELPRKPQDAAQLSPLAEPNISATVFALEALRVAGVETSGGEIQKARHFVERCQNVAPEETEPTAFDDGGFFFLQTDPFRNKAGIAGRDDRGSERYASYGSATTDGLRALLLCGERDDSPRVRAAFRWLADNFSATHQPGQFVVEAARDAVYFYYCRSLTLLLGSFEDAVAANSVDRIQWAQEVASALRKRQRVDGSWINADVEVREDDPLIATSLAMSAIATCQQILQHADSDHHTATGR